MAQTVVEEPKSVVEEVVKTKCDTCGYRSEDEDEFVTDYRTEGVGTSKHSAHVRPDEMFHLCEECSGKSQHASYMDTVDKRQHRASQLVDGVEWGFNGLTLCFASMVALGVTKTVSAFQLIANEGTWWLMDLILSAVFSYVFILCVFALLSVIVTHTKFDLFNWEIELTVEKP